MKDWKTETVTIQEMTMTQRTSRQKQRAARQGRTTLRQKKKGGKARTEENSNKSEPATEMINEQGGEFPFAMGSESPRNEVKMIISQRTETGIQTSETGHKMGDNGKVTGGTPIGERLLGSRETKNPCELERKKKSTVV